MVSSLLVLAISIPCLIRLDDRDNASPPGSMKFLGMTDEERKQIFEDQVKQMQFYPSAAEANKVLPFELRLPKSELCGELKGIYVRKGTRPTELVVYAFYNDIPNGITIDIQPLTNKPDFQAIIKQNQEEYETGIMKADKVPVPVTVNNLDGRGGEPGFNIVNGHKYPRPGFVSWWDNGLLYAIRGTRGENGTSLDALLKIANSMYSA